MDINFLNSNLIVGRLDSELKYDKYPVNAKALLPLLAHSPVQRLNKTNEFEELGSAWITVPSEGPGHEQLAGTSEILLLGLWVEATLTFICRTVYPAAPLIWSYVIL